MTTHATAFASELARYQLDSRNRPLRLILDRPDAGGAQELLPQRVSGSESVCGGFEFQILCVSQCATLALKDFIGVPCELQIVTDRGTLRRLCGIVTTAASGQGDGGMVTYKLTLRDALAVMDGNINTRVFRDLNELDIIQLLLREWQTRNPVIASTSDFHIADGLRHRPLPPRSFTMQANESDAGFIRRLLQRRGIGWFFRPGFADAQATAGGNAPPRIGHTLEIFDDSVQLARNAAGSVRFHRDAATEERDAITGWSGERMLVPGSASLHSWDYRQPAAATFMNASSLSHANQGSVGNRLAAGIDDYQVAAPHLGDNARDLRMLADAQMMRHEYLSKCFHGEGSVRDLAVGEWFSFEGHSEIDTHPAKERDFVVTAQRIVATNNLPAEIGARVERLFALSGWDCDGHTSGTSDMHRPLRYTSRFSCVRRGVRIVPPTPVMPRTQLQTAIVVGPRNEEVWCDPLGRVKIRFPATRTEDHAHASGAGSADSDSDSAWVRVASSWAGNGLGPDRQCGVRMLTPVGSEVLVAFAGDDPDRPVIVAQVYNDAAPPPHFAHEDGLPDSRHQSGMRSREVRGQRGNQLRLDDTSGQISAQLASDHAATELNLGYLTEARRQGSAHARGEGAELRTDEAIALHATRGILLSAWKLLGGTGAKGSQLARDDYLALLRECGELCTSLGNYASEHNGLATDTGEQDALRERFDSWEDGSNTLPKAPQPREPVIAVTAPAGIGFASAKAIVTYSASNVDTVAQQHLQFTAGQRYSLNAGKGISLFAQHGGLHAIAHHGKLLLQSQHDDTAIDSAKNMQLTASEGTATISAKVILLVAQDGSFLKLGDGPPVLGSKAPLKFHAPDFTFEGPQSMAAQFPEFGTAGADQRLELRYPRGVAGEDGSEPLGGVVEDMKMKMSLSDGSSVESRSGADGKSELLEREAMHMVDIILSRGGDQ